MVREQSVSDSTCGRTLFVFFRYGEYFRSTNISPELTQWCHKHDMWPYVMPSIQDDDQWKFAVVSMFKDGVYTRGRLLVIKIFTADIAEALEKTQR